MQFRQWFSPGIKRLAAGLATVLGIKPLGFFIPCRYAGHATSAAAMSFARVEEIFANARENFHAVIGDIEACAPELRAIAANGGGADGTRPHFRQGLFPRLDAATRMRDLWAGTVIAEIGLADGVFDTSLWLRKR